MTTCLGKSCSFCLPRVPFVNCRQFMYLVISLLVLRAGYGIWLYQFLIIAYLFTFPHFYYMLGANLGLLLYGEVSVMLFKLTEQSLWYDRFPSVILIVQWMSVLAKGVWNAKEWCFLTCLIVGTRSFVGILAAPFSPCKALWFYCIYLSSFRSFRSRFVGHFGPRVILFLTNIY